MPEKKTDKKTQKKEKNKDQQPEKKPEETTKNKEPKEEKQETTSKPKNPEKDTVRINPKILIIALIIAALGIYLYQSATDTTTPTTTNTTGIAQRGDKVYILFTQKLEDGTVLETNMQEIAEQEGLEKDSYPPLIFTIGEGYVPKGLEDAVIGMKPKDTKTITLAPEDAYGLHKDELEVEAERIQEQDRIVVIGNYESMTDEHFEELFNKKVKIVGNEVTTYATPWTYTITAVSDNNITVRANIEEGKTYTLPDMIWDATAITVTDEDSIFRLDPEEGSIVETQIGPAEISTTEDKIILTINPEIGNTYTIDDMSATVTKLTDTTITIDANHPLAGKTVIFDIELLQIARATTE